MLIGHQKQWQYLRNLAQGKRIPHALLFSGQESLGKRTVALEFVKLLNCRVSRAGQDIDKGQYPDLVIIEPIKKAIQISQIRELSWRLSFRPYFSTFKVAIIDQAHSMNQQAQSCLLKTLEEPKGRALLILITEHPESLLPTVLSRVEKLPFYSVNVQEMEKYFPKEIVSLSSGRPGRAMNFLSNPEKLKEYKQRIEKIAKISSSDYVDRFQYAKELSQQPQKLNEILETWLRYFRKLLLSENHSRYINILKNIEKTQFLISSTNVNPRLALETLMLEL